MRTKNNFILYNEITMVPVLLWLTVYEALHLYLTKVVIYFNDSYAHGIKHI